MQFEIAERDFVQRSVLLLAQYERYVMTSVPEREHYVYPARRKRIERHR